jgi:hypothetical protein
MCVVNSLIECGSLPDCVILNESCVSILRNCDETLSSVDCYSLVYCDFFISGYCKNKLLYDGVCEVVGQNICSNTSDCVWDTANGCVKIKIEKSEPFNILILIIISLLEKNIFILFII